MMPQNNQRTILKRTFHNNLKNRFPFSFALEWMLTFFCVTRDANKEPFIFKSASVIVYKHFMKRRNMKTNL